MTSDIPQIEKPPSVIDCLQRGFSLIGRYPWLLALPLLLDLLLWRGPQITLTPFLDHLIKTLFSQPNLPSDLSQNAELVTKNMHLLGNSINLMNLLSGVVIGVPSYWGQFGTIATAQSANPLIVIERWQQLLVAIVTLIPAGLLIGGIWLAGIVNMLDQDLRGFSNFLRRCGWIWLNTGLYTLMLFAAMLVLFIILSLVSLVGMLLAGVNGATIAVWTLLFVGSLFGLWLVVGLKFVVNAIAIDRVNMARAIWRSLNVVGRNVSSTIGFILLSLLLTQGFARIWLALNGSTLGISVGMLGNAFIGTSVMAASLYFYRSRYQHWQQTKPPLRTATSNETFPPSPEL